MKLNLRGGKEQSDGELKNKFLDSIEVKSVMVVCVQNLQKLESSKLVY